MGNIEEAIRRIAEASSKKANELDLSRLGLTKEDLEVLLPMIKEKLPNLLKLFLYSNQIKEVPPSIGELENLQTLNLEKNRLERLPDTIGDLKNLKYLWGSYNQLREVPPSIGNLENLQELSLYSNRIEAVPDTIGDLKNLQALGLGNNRIEAVPHTIGGLENLRSLYLGDNRIRVFPETLAHLPRLRNLRAGNNPLTLETMQWLNLTFAHLGHGLQYNMGAHQGSRDPKEELVRLYRHDRERHADITRRFLLSVAQGKREGGHPVQFFAEGAHRTGPVPGPL